jgi:hypothetical protein
MKDIVSVAVQFVPMVVVALFLARRDGYAKKNILKYVGPALAASGAATWVGVRFFGLAVYGKRAAMEGSGAETGALAMMAIGAAVFALHYVIVGGVRIVFGRFSRDHQRAPVSDADERVAEAERPPADRSEGRSVAVETTPCRCAKCGSLLGNRDVTVCPVCGHRVSLRTTK